MNKLIPFALLAVLTLTFLLLAVAPASTNTNDVIIVNGADALRQTGVGANSSLSGLLGQVVPRIRVQYAQSLRRFGLEPVPDPLVGLLGGVQARIRLSFGDALRHIELLSAPAPLATTLGSVSDRIRLSYANSSRHMTLNYPAALLDDTTPPTISNVTSTVGGTISWTTNEFASSTVRYGTASGAYTHTVENPSFVKQHQLHLTGMQPGLRYYFVISSTDLSGNVATSDEYSLIQQMSINLPIILKGK